MRRWDCLGWAWNFARCRLIHPSLPTTARRTASSSTASGAATRMRPCGGYTPKCRLLIGLRTTSTVKPLTVMLRDSVFMLMLDQFQQGIQPLVVLPCRTAAQLPSGVFAPLIQHMLDRQTYALDLHGIATPVILPAIQRGSVHSQCEACVLL